MRFAIRVKPGAKRIAVGGDWQGALVVAVSAPAVDGKANLAVRRALADAFGIGISAVAIVRGTTGRDKLVELDPAPADAPDILAALRESGPMLAR